MTKLGPFLAGICALSAMTAWAQTSDTTAPLLTAFSFTPASVNVSTASQIVTVNATITDDLAGVSSANVRFISPSGAQQSTFVSLFRTTGTPLSGVYQAIVTFPRFVEAGTWKAAVGLFDLAGNSRQLSAINLTSLGFPTDVTVTDATVDTQPPTILAASFSPPSVDVSSGTATTVVSLQISDNASGTVFNIGGFAVTMSPVSGSNAQHYIGATDFHLTAGTALNGTWQATTTIPQFSTAGAWRITSISLRDAASNQINLSTSQLQAAGVNPILTVNSVPSDSVSPVLTGLTFSPPLFNTSLAPQTVTLTVSATDDLSGISFAPTTSSIALVQFVLTSPSGGQTVFVNPFLPAVLVAGNPLSGTWQLQATWPQFSEEGTWKISSLTIKDAVGNQVIFTADMLAARGLPNSVVVTKPSLVTDGTVGPSGGTVLDNSFGTRASVTFPPGVVSTNTNISIDVFGSPLAVPTPTNFTMPGTYFVNFSFTPSPGSPIPAPGITLVLPLINPMTAGAHLSLYHIDPVTGSLAPAMNTFHSPVVGTVNADGLSATFTNVVTLSTVVAYLSNGSVLGDANNDGLVTCADVSIVKASLGKRTGQAGFNIAADFNNDGVVDVKDLMLVSRLVPAGLVCQ